MNRDPLDIAYQKSYSVPEKPKMTRQEAIQLLKKNHVYDGTDPVNDAYLRSIGNWNPTNEEISKLVEKMSQASATTEEIMAEVNAHVAEINPLYKSLAEQQEAINQATAQHKANLLADGMTEPDAERLSKYYKDCRERLAHGLDIEIPDNAAGIYQQDGGDNAAGHARVTIQDDVLFSPAMTSIGFIDGDDLGKL